MLGTMNERVAVQPAERLQSLDAYRGLIMITLSFVGFGLAGTSANYLKDQPDSSFWQAVNSQFSHAQWVGCSYWDLIQPSFMFMVGVSMAFSYAKRKSLGHSYSRMFFHAFVRSLILVLLSIFLISMWSDQTNWSFTNVLAQMGLAYTFLFLFWDRAVVVQLLGAGLILGGTWIAYETYSPVGIDVATGASEVGVSQEWAETNLGDVRKPWHKNANLGHAIDLTFLNWFPRSEPFKFSQGGYQTINFVPSLVTMLFGLMCGELLRSGRSAQFKMLVLLLAASAGLGVGFALDAYDVCPLVKRIWTPSWTLFSSGWCCLILGALYGVMDILKFRIWAFPLLVVGMNSIAIYCMSMTLKPWIARQLQTHLGDDIFSLYNMVPSQITPSIQAIMVGTVLWLVCYYMYRNKIFVRI